MTATFGPRYIMLPQVKVTLDDKEFINSRLVTAQVIQNLNGFDTATVALTERLADLYPDRVNVNSVVAIDVKDTRDAVYKRLFAGIVRFPVLPLQSNELVTLKCDGVGFGLGNMKVFEEYGSQSRNPTLVSLYDMLTDSNFGVLPRYVNKVLGSSQASGFNYSYYGSALGAVLPYVSGVDKPANKFINDLCDLYTAVRYPDTGAIWRAGADGYVRVRQIDAYQTGWTQYYGERSAGDDTHCLLVEGQGRDFQNGDFEPQGKTANFILLHGIWRRPSGGDSWTEATAVGWDKTEVSTTLEAYATRHVVGSYSLRARTSANPAGQMTWWYPTGRAAGWDFSLFGEFNTPTLNFYCFFDAPGATMFHIFLCTTATDYYDLIIEPEQNAWSHWSFPVGPFFNLQKDAGIEWSKTGNPDWSNINWLEFYQNSTNMYNAGTDRNMVCLDGLHFGGARITRIAREKYESEGGTLGTLTNPVCMASITDDQGKDDSLKASDDSGTMAQLAKAELLRQQKSVILGKFSTGLIADALPGQKWYIKAKPKKYGTYTFDEFFLATRVVHDLSAAKCWSTFNVTNDLTNSRSRLRFEDLNTTYAAIRPEYQDRQAANMKAGQLDLRQPRLEKYY